jgi:hypothetical protein
MKWPWPAVRNKKGCFSFGFCLKIKPQLEKIRGIKKCLFSILVNHFINKKGEWLELVSV